MSLAGHLWTMRGYLVRQRLDIEPPPSEDWSTELADPIVGKVVLTGRLAPEGDDVIVIIHGLGGCAESGYVRLAVRAAAAMGLASLALNVRGADRSGEDYSHAALTADVAAAIASLPLAGYGRIFLLGFSLGGHLALRYATETPDARLQAVAGICCPLDLAACCDNIDRPGAILYRRYLLDRLLEIYAEVAKRRSVPVPVGEARRIRSQREFDRRIIAPRHGFESVEDYYRRASVGPLLRRLRVPALLVLALQDPMVPAASLRPYLDPAPPQVEVRWVSGGHVGFPPGVDLGQPAALGVETQTLAWLQSAASSSC